MVRQISVYGMSGNGGSLGHSSNTAQKFQGTFEKDFYVPIGVETELSRDTYGQVKGKKDAP